MEKHPHQLVQIPPHQVQGGYPDFVSEDVQMKVLDGPSRKSMKEDLSFYLTTHSNNSNFVDFDNISPGRIFVNKIICSHYLQVYQYIRAYEVDIMKSITDIRNVHKTDDHTIYRTTNKWIFNQVLSRRLSWLCEDIESNMLQCGVPLEDLDMGETRSWTEFSVDFRFLYRRFREVFDRTKGLDTAISVLIQTAGSQRQLKEAQNAGALTLLGLFFIPLAYTASLFSMASPYGPGYSQFWLYFITSIPLMLFVFLLYFHLTGKSFRKLADQRHNL